MHGQRFFNPSSKPRPRSDWDASVRDVAVECLPGGGIVFERVSRFSFLASADFCSSLIVDHVAPLMHLITLDPRRAPILQYVAAIEHIEPRFAEIEPAASSRPATRPLPSHSGAPCRKPGIVFRWWWTTAKAAIICCPSNGLASIISAA